MHCTKNNWSETIHYSKSFITRFTHKLISKTCLFMLRYLSLLIYPFPKERRDKKRRSQFPIPFIPLAIVKYEKARDAPGKCRKLWTIVRKCGNAWSPGIYDMAFRGKLMLPHTPSLSRITSYLAHLFPFLLCRAALRLQCSSRFCSIPVCLSRFAAARGARAALCPCASMTCTSPRVLHHAFPVVVYAEGKWRLPLCLYSAYLVYMYIFIGSLCVPLQCLFCALVACYRPSPAFTPLTEPYFVTFVLSTTSSCSWVLAIFPCLFAPSRLYRSRGVLRAAVVFAKTSADTLCYWRALSFCTLYFFVCTYELYRVSWVVFQGLVLRFLEISCFRELRLLLFLSRGLRTTVLVTSRVFDHWPAFCPHWLAFLKTITTLFYFIDCRSLTQSRGVFSSPLPFFILCSLGLHFILLRL